MVHPIHSAKQLYRESLDDDLTGEAAKVAYYAFLSLFPLVLVVFTLTGIVGGDAAFHWIMGQLVRFVPPETAQYLGSFVAEITQHSRPGLLSVGLLGALWSASNIFTALATSLNRMYDVRETRSFWKVRGLALLLLALGTVALIGGAVVILAGPRIVDAFGLGRLWSVLSLPVTFLVLVAMLCVTYYVLPDRDQRHAKLQVLIGAIVGSALWLGATALFRLYVTHFGGYSRTYGLVGAVIVLLLWLYVTGFVILFGAEIAAVLEARGSKVQVDETDGLHAPAHA